MIGPASDRGLETLVMVEHSPVTKRRSGDSASCNKTRCDLPPKGYGEFLRGVTSAEHEIAVKVFREHGQMAESYPIRSVLVGTLSHTQQHSRVLSDLLPNNSSVNW
jgi:hypothetical protein